MKFWPFLITASKQFDYTLVVCPKLLKERNQVNIWRRPEFGITQPSPDLQVTTITDVPNGPMCFVYSVSAVTGKGNGSGTEVRDGAGRVIYQAMGFVAFESELNNVATDRRAEIVASLASELGAVRDRFLGATAWEPKVSGARDSDEGEGDRDHGLVSRARRVLRGKSIFLASGAVAAIAATSAMVYLALPAQQTDPIVRVSGSDLPGEKRSPVPAPTNNAEPITAAASAVGGGSSPESVESLMTAFARLGWTGVFIQDASGDARKSLIALSASEVTDPVLKRFCTSAEMDSLHCGRRVERSPPLVGASH